MTWLRNWLLTGTLALALGLAGTALSHHDAAAACSRLIAANDPAACSKPVAPKPSGAHQNQGPNGHGPGGSQQSLGHTTAHQSQGAANPRLQAALAPSTRLIVAGTRTIKAPPGGKPTQQQPRLVASGAHQNQGPNGHGPGGSQQSLGHTAARQSQGAANPRLQAALAPFARQIVAGTRTIKAPPGGKPTQQQPRLVASGAHQNQGPNGHGPGGSQQSLGHTAARQNQGAVNPRLQAALAPFARQIVAGTRTTKAPPGGKPTQQQPRLVASGAHQNQGPNGHGPGGSQQSLGHTAARQSQGAVNPRLQAALAPFARQIVAGTRTIKAPPGGKPTQQQPRLVASGAHQNQGPNGHGPGGSQQSLGHTAANQGAANPRLQAALAPFARQIVAGTPNGAEIQTGNQTAAATHGGPPLNLDSSAVTAALRGSLLPGGSGLRVTNPNCSPGVLGPGRTCAGSGPGGRDPSFSFTPAAPGLTPGLVATQVHPTATGPQLEVQCLPGSAPCTPATPRCGLAPQPLTGCRPVPTVRVDPRQVATFALAACSLLLEEAAPACDAASFVLAATNNDPLGACGGAAAHLGAGRVGLGVSAACNLGSAIVSTIQGDTANAGASAGLSAQNVRDILTTEP